MDYSPAELATAIAVKILDENEEVDKKLVYGLFDALKSKFFPHSEDTFWKAWNHIDQVKSKLKLSELVEYAAATLSEAERKNCYDICHDLVDVDENRSVFDDGFLRNMQERFTIDFIYSMERSDAFRPPSQVEYRTFVYKNMFSLSFPHDWKPQEDVNEVVRVLCKKAASRTIDCFHESISVSVEGTQELNLEEYVAAFLKTIEGNSKDYYLYGKKPEPLIINEGFGYSAYYSFVHEDLGELKSKSFIHVKNDMAYVITGHALENTLTRYEEIFDEAGKTFRLL
jgi:hypothetical protein